MIEQPGRVTRVEGGFAWVETERAGGCGSCSTGGCGAGALNRWFAARPHELRAGNGVGAQPGEQVMIGIGEQTLLRGSFLVYVLPLLFMIAGGLIGQLLGPQLGFGGDGAAVLGGVSGLLAGFALLLRKSRGLAQNPEYHAHILRRTGTPTQTIHFVHSD